MSAPPPQPPPYRPPYTPGYLPPDASASPPSAPAWGAGPGAAWSPRPPVDPEVTSPAPATRLPLRSAILGAVGFGIAIVCATVVLVFSPYFPDVLTDLVALGAVVGVGIGVAGLISGLVARRRLRRHPELEGSGQALGGIILGILAIAAPLMAFVLAVAVDILRGG